MYGILFTFIVQINKFSLQTINTINISISIKYTAIHNMMT